MPVFDEQRWQVDQRRREEELFRLVKTWLEQQSLPPALHERMAQRLLSGTDARLDCPSLYALRLADALGVPAKARDATGVVMTLFWAAADASDDVDDQEPSQVPATANDACALLLLAQRALLDALPGQCRLACDYGLKMAEGQVLDLASSDRPRSPDLEAMVRGKAGAELAFFFGLAAHGVGAEATPVFTALGEAFGCALQVFSDVTDLYLKPVSPDFLAGKWTWPLFYFRQEAQAVWLEAFPRHHEDVLIRVRFEAAVGSQRALQHRADALRAAWAGARPHLANPEPVEHAVGWLLASMGALHDGLGELGEPPPLPPRVSVTDALTRACAFLSDHDAAEEHRWGLFGAPYVSGNLYPLLMKAVALRAAGAPWEALLQRLLSLRDGDGFRYYPGAFDIPPDADDTGLILGHFVEFLPGEIRLASAQQLLHSFEDDRIHTWMGVLPPGIRWEGDDCLSTLANACWGLMKSGFGESVPTAVWEKLLWAAKKDVCASPFYPPTLTRMFVHRAVAEAALQGWVPLLRAREAQRTLEERLWAVERLAGQHGETPQRTAAWVLSAAAWGLPLRREAIRTWLCERQEADGRWAAEPFTRTPGVAMRPRVWGSPETTTCWVVLALLELGETSSG